MQIKVNKCDIIRHQIINYLSEISKNNPTEEHYNLCLQKVNEFLDYIQNINSSNQSNSINWPINYSKYIISNISTDSIKIYDHLIWYSKISNIFERIIDKNNTKIIHTILDLNEFPEIESIYKLLISRIMNNLSTNEIGLQGDDYDIMYATLNAAFIYKMHQDKLDNYIFELDELLNQLMERNEKGQNEIIWAYDHANKFHPNFSITLPKFKPKDFIFMFINLSGDNIARNGIFIKNYDYPTIFSELKNLNYNSRFNTMYECSIEIARIIYRNLYDIKYDPTTQLEDINVLIQKKYKEKNDNNKELLSSIIYMLQIAEKFDKFKSHELKYNDVEFLKLNWKNNNEFIKRYPSLVYWLCKNHKCAQQMQTIYSSQIFEKDKLPFWILILRIISSINFVVFNINEHTYINQILNEEISNTIKEKLLNNEDIGTKWLNLLLPTVPPEFVDKNTKLMYGFLFSLSEDKEFENNRFITNNYIQSFIKEIVKLVFNSNLEEIFNKKPSESNVLRFIIDPNKFIHDKIQSLIKENCKKVINSDEIKELITFLETMKKKYTNNTNFSEMIKNIQTNKTDEYVKIEMAKSEMTRKEKINELKMMIEKYKKYINEIEKNEKVSDKTLKQIEEYKKYFEENYPNLDENNSKIIQRKKENSFTHVELISYSSDVNIKFYLFPDNIDLEELISNEEKRFYENNAPKILFGKHSSEEFLSSLDKMYTNLDTGIKLIIKTLENSDDLKQEIFKIPKELLKDITSLQNDLTPKFTDDSSFPDNNDISYLPKNLENIKNSLGKFNSEIKDNIKSIWKQYINLKENLFSYTYKIPYPSITPKNLYDLPSFSQINDTNILSTPILNISSEGAIQCCYKSLYCPIGPIIPSLYEGNISINFISFIDEPFSIDIKTEQEEYLNIFYTEHNINPGDIIQLLVSFPPILNNDITLLNISTQIHFTSQSYKELILPCEFNFKLIPLSLLLVCEEYNLLYEDGMYNLCCQEILSKSTITFKLKNYYINEDLRFITDIISLDDNGSNKPLMDIFNDRVVINIPSVDEMTRLHCNLCLTFTPNFMILIHIDTKILPFDFKFEIYDFSIKSFTNNVNIYYSDQKNVWKVPLYFKIHGIPGIKKQQAKIIQNLPVNSKFMEDINEINIQEYYIFKLTLKFDLLFCDSTKNYSIQIVSNNLIKKVSINFIKINLQHANSYPIMIFNYSTNNWERYEINSTDIKTTLVTLATPFNFVEASDKVFYEENTINIHNRSVKYISGCENGEFNIVNDIPLCYTSNNSNDSQYYIPIIGIFEDDQWFPAFSIYPEIDVDKFNELEITNQNIKCAKDNINCICSTSSYDIKHSNDRDFMLFVLLLSNDIVIIKIKDLINILPQELQDKTKDLIPNDEIKIDDPILGIYKYNIIIRFYKLFKQNYNYLNISSMKQNEISSQAKMKELYEEYIQFDKNKYKRKTDETTNRKDKENFENLKKQTQNDPNEKGSKCYLINEFKQPKKKDYFTKQKIIKQENIKRDISPDSINFNFDLFSILIPEEPQKESISSLIQFYSLCIQGTRVLPIYIHNLIISKQSFKPAEEYYSKLLQIYRILPNDDHSFLSTYINSFCKSFKLLTSKLNKAGVDFNGLKLPIIISQKLYEDFIQIPHVCNIYSQNKNWKTIHDENNVKPNQYELFNQSNNQILSNDLFENVNDQLPYIPKEKETEETQIVIEQHHINKIDEVLYRNTVTNMQNIIQNENEIENEVDDNEEKPLLLTKDEALIVQVNNKQFDGIISEFTEFDGIKRAIQRMKEMGYRKDDNIILKQEGYTIDRKISKPNTNNFPITKLIQQSYCLSASFIKVATNSTVPYSNICSCILVDCSSFISDENKMFNMLIICALTYALSSLEIPYSVLLIADERFKCIIKPFEEEHSYIVLQRILDCLLIKRYRTNLLHSIKFAMDSIPESILKIRPNVSFFTFTDGLDENLIRTQVWSNLLTNPHYSFGFIFIKSNKLIEENLTFVENVWNNFESEVKQLGAKSIINVSSIQAEINNQTTKTLIEMFRNIIKREENQDLLPQYKEITLAEFSENIPKINKLKYFKEILKLNYSHFKGIYSGRTNVLSTISNSNRSSKLEMLHYRNKINKINSNIRKNENQELEIFIHTFIQNKKNFNFNSSLDTIFKPNKASQTILSSTGTNFDITALILNILNPVPDPLIYLAEKGGLIRNYGVTIIIDPSISCFNELSSAHSLQTIQNLLSVFTILDLPSFDLIIAGSPTPNILCSGINTFKALSAKSTLWESLFGFLQNQETNVDLASAIHTALDLKRIRSTDYSNILFVITDGLYQKNEQKRILEQVNSCVQYGINTIGIGVGIYPKGIINLFPQVVYSPNPSYLINGIASIFGDDISGKLDEIPLIQNPAPNLETLNKIFKELILNQNNPTFIDLKNELHNIPPSLDAFSDFYNEEQDVGSIEKEFVNPSGKNTEMYTKDFLKGQKILIVMLWTCELSNNESEFVHPDYIFKSNEPGHTECIKTAVDHFGIEIKVVLNYYDAN